MMQIYDYCQQIYQKPQGKLLFIIGNIALGGLLILTASSQVGPVWQHYQQSEKDDQTPVKIERPVSSIQLSREVANKHLFGRIPNNAPVAVATNITVMGIFLADNDKQSSAVLVVDNNPEANYWPGDELPGNGKLVEVRADRVIVLQNGLPKSVPFDMQAFADTGVKASPRVSDAPETADNNQPSAEQWREVRRRMLRERAAQRRAGGDVDSDPRGGPASFRDWRRFLPGAGD